MLDVNETLFNVNLQSINVLKSRALVINGCMTTINITKKDIYSKLDELN